MGATWTHRLEPNDTTVSAHSAAVSAPLAESAQENARFVTQSSSAAEYVLVSDI